MYKEYLPDNINSQYLEAVWVSENETEKTIFPDNCSDIIIPLVDSKKPLFVGHMTSFLVHKPEPKERLLGLRFKPGYSNAFVKDDMSLFSDKMTDLSILLNDPFDEIREKYLTNDFIDFDSLSKIIYKLCSNFTLDPDISFSINLIKETYGSIRIDKTSQSVGVSKRLLEKKFKFFLGKTPKRFAQIERFNAYLQNKDEINYYDQSHMIREFKMLTGVTPTKLPG